MNLQTQIGALLKTPDASHGSSGRLRPERVGGPRFDLQDQIGALLPTPTVSDVKGTDFGPYTAAVERWEGITRPAPPPTVERGGKPRLNPRFVEWMMGLPDGWVTKVPGISNAAALKMLGNGVVPQQAALALQHLDPR